MELKNKKITPYATAVLTSAMRTFRALLCYVNQRLLKITQETWKYGGTLADGHQEVLEDNEKKFYIDYKNMIYDYQNSLPVDLDLFTDLEPPKDLIIEVRVLDDCGEIVTKDGSTLTLEKGTSVSARRCDVEQLIRQNLVVQTK